MQTPRDLRQLNEPNIQEFLAAIDAPIRRYGGGLSANDEVGRRRTSGYRLRACHATLLKRGGAVPNHVHDFGWITAIYFVETPKQPNARAGWIKFGEPPWALAGAGPEHWIEPRAGQIILFPSYFWHGVEPLGESGERVSITFDIVPA